jgi:sugar/nucleoside kinase (ribokinase family)
LSVLCSGNIVCDILVRPADALVWGGTVQVERIERSLGGNGANTAYALAKLGGRVLLAGMLGVDAEGEFARRQLEAAGVDMSLVGRSSKPTAASIVLVASNGDRAFLHLTGASADVTLEPEAIARSGCNRYHLASPFGVPLLRARKAELLRAARDAGLKTSLDLHWDSRGEWMRDLGPCLPFVDILFANRDEARMLTGFGEPESAARALRDAGAAAVVLKLGAEGCFLDAGDLALRAPPYEVDAMDTTGAGDCFAGAFLAGLEHGQPPMEAARLANAAGALSVMHLGAVTGLRGYSEMRSWMETARVRAAP